VEYFSSYLEKNSSKCPCFPVVKAHRRNSRIRIVLRTPTKIWSVVASTTSHYSENFRRHSSANSLRNPINTLAHKGENKKIQQAVRVATQYASAPCDLDLWPFDLESGVRVACNVPILFFLGASVLDLDPMYVRHQTRIIASSLNASSLSGRRHKNITCFLLTV